MRRVLILTSALVAVMASATTQAAVAGPVGGLQIGGLGDAPASITRQIALAKSVNAKIVRTTIDWSAAEPAQGQFDQNYLSRYDALQQQASARGLKVLTTVTGTPCWASSAPDKSGCAGGVTPLEVGRYKPTNGADAAGIFAEVARHSGPSVAGIEVWNEPDQANELYFKGPDKVTTYVAMLKAAYGAIKGVNPNLTVLGGALVDNKGNFLQAMYDQGAKGSYDALDVHYYDLPLAKLRLIRSVMTRNGDSSPVWLGEFGFNSCRSIARKQGPHLCLTQKNQARALGDVLGALRRTSWVKAAVVYNYSDDGGRNGFRFGVTTTSGKHKPAYKTLQRAFAGRYTTHKLRVRLRRQNGRTRVYVSGPYGDAYTLTVRIPNGGFFKLSGMRFGSTPSTSRLLPRVLGTHHLKVTLTSFWNGRSVRRTLG